MYVDNSGRLRKSRQQEMDERMCKPGYTWQERSWEKDGGKCVPAVSFYGNGMRSGYDRYPQPNSQVETHQQQQLPTNTSVEGAIANELKTRSVAPQAQQLNAKVEKQVKEAVKLEQIGEKAKEISKKQRKELEQLQ